MKNNILLLQASKNLSCPLVLPWFDDFAVWKSNGGISCKKLYATYYS